MDSSEVKYFKSSDIGAGRDFALTPPDHLQTTEDIFIPSIRDFHVIFWVLSGRGSYYVDFKEYSFEPNTLILLSKDQLHYFNKFEQPVEMQSITFKPEFVYKNEQDIAHLYNFFSSAHNPERQQLNVFEKDQLLLKSLSDGMNKAYQSADANKSKEFYHWLCLFLMHCEKMGNLQHGASSFADGDVGRLVFSFSQLIEDNFKSETSVSFYAEKLQVTTKKLVELSKTYFKTSPKSVIDERRILEIKRQLLGTDKSSKMIAYELNFGEPTNMFKYFRKHTGMSPKEFKNTPSS